MATDPKHVLDMTTRDGVKFGKELRDKAFLFDQNFLNLNHGSFGTYPLPIRTTLRSFQDAAESRPDQFIRYEYPSLLDASRTAMSTLLNTPSSNLVFVPNATTGIHTILNNIEFNEGDHILYLAPIYGSCEKIVAYVTEKTPARAKRIDFTYPVEDDWIIEACKRAVREVEEQGGKVKTAVFDTVVSVPGVRMPFERLTALCRDLGVLSCIDGAHGVGHVEMDLESLDADFLVSNCHKWLHVPRGCAVLFVAQRNQPLIRSTIPTSHGFEPRNTTIASPLPTPALVDSTRTRFTANFEFVGTLDNAPYLCVPAALEWRSRVLGGEASIMRYCHALANEAGRHVSSVLGTELLDNTTHTMTRCCMVNVRLPICPVKTHALAKQSGVPDEDVGVALRDWLNRRFVHDHGTFLQNFWYAGKWWVRLSAQVYLDMRDFEWAARVIQDMCARAERGEWIGVQTKL